MKLEIDENKIVYKKIKNLKSNYNFKCGVDLTPLEQDVLDPNYNWIALKKSMEKYGVKTPLVLIRSSDAVIDGNHRLAIAKLIYNPEYKIPCVYDDEVKFLQNYNKFSKSAPCYCCKYCGEKSI